MTPRKPGSIFRSILTLVSLSVWILYAVGCFLLASVFARGKREAVPRHFHRGCCRLFGLDIITRGELHRGASTLFVCNHISYLDIFALGGIVPGCFIAKSEVAGWPLLGSLAKLQNTLFFERKGKNARAQIDIMQAHLREGGNLILFPEGTSTEGAHVEPFKSTLFNAADMPTDQPVIIQPITIAYTRWRQRPMTQQIRDHFAWYATMPFATHFFNMLGMGSAQVELIFHPPVQLKDFESRKACADYCYRQVADALTDSLPENADEEPENDENPAPA